MPKKTIRGVTSIKMGAIAGDGGMGTSLSEIGYTVRDTVIFSNAEGTTQDFFVEEQDDAIESVETERGATTLAFSTSNIEADTLVRLFGGTKTPAVAAGVGAVATLGSITGGSSYVNGTYTDVPLTGGAGTGATADITVAGGAVTAVVIKNRGANYAVSNNLSASNTNLGGAGTGFTVPVATVQAIPAVGEIYEPPATAEEKELSIEIIDKKGTKLEVVRAKVRTTMQMNFQRTNLAQLDVVATVLTPTKANTAAWKLTLAS